MIVVEPVAWFYYPLLKLSEGDSICKRLHAVGGEEEEVSTGQIGAASGFVTA
ncbi:hypothetical protein J6590_020892 [Homalodisca vitripennis]|nr:hypothetical protein J6590_020892 [Homalodisca vitripennis]